MRSRSFLYCSHPALARHAGWLEHLGDPEDGSLWAEFCEAAPDEAALVRARTPGATGACAVAVLVVSAALPLLLLGQLAIAFQLTYEPGMDSPALLQLTQNRAPSPEALQIDCTRARQGRCSQRATVGPGPRFIQAGATRAEADAMCQMSISLIGPLCQGS